MSIQVPNNCLASLKKSTNLSTNLLIVLHCSFIVVGRLARTHVMVMLLEINNPKPFQENYFMEILISIKNLKK